MIFDKQLTFADRQHLLATGYSYDTIDLGEAKTLGDDNLNFVVTVNAESGTNTVTAELQTSSDNSTFAVAASVVRPTGAKSFGLPLGNLALKRYNRVRFVVGGSNDVTLTAGITAGVQEWKAVADSARIG